MGTPRVVWPPSWRLDVSPRALAGRWWPDALALAVLSASVVGFGLFFSHLALLQHRGVETAALDLGYTDQLLWHTLRGQPYRVTLLEDAQFPLGEEAAAIASDSYQAFHVAPVFLALAQIYRWWPGPETLLIVQAWALGLGAVPAYLLARRRLSHRAAGVALGVVYLLSPSFAGASLSDFHPVALAPPLVLLGAYFLERRSYMAFAVCAAALLSLREQMGLVLGVWGLVIAMSHRTWRGLSFGLGLSALALGWFGYAAGVLIPEAGGPPLTLDGYSWLGRSNEEIVDRVPLSSPIDWSLALRPAATQYLTGLFQSVGYLALLAPLAVLPAVPLFLANLLAPFPWMLSEGAHFSVAIQPFLIVGGIAGLGKVAALLRRWRMAPSVATTAAVVLMGWGAWTHHLAAGIAPWVPNFEAPLITAHDQRLAEFLAVLPSDAAVSAQSSLVPHLSQRARVYLFPNVRDAEYVLLDVTTTPFPVSADELWYRAQLLLRSGQFGVAAAADGYLLLERGAVARDLPIEFYTFARAEAADVRYPVMATFGSELQLLGFDAQVAPMRDRDSRLLSLETFWQVLRKPRDDYQVALAFATDTQLITYDVGSSSTSWLPVRQWVPGHIVRVAFPSINVSNRSDVGVAVVKPKKPPTLHNRVSITESPMYTWALEGESWLRLFGLHSFLTAPQARQLTGSELGAVTEVLASQPSSRSPLCGRPVEDGSLLFQRPVLVKIDNAPAARPQSGLAAACLVYEYMAEGGITRFGAFYHTEDLDTVGPVRSARLMDAELGPAYGALVAHVGGSQPVLAYLREQAVLDVDQFFNARAYRRSPDRPAPHNVYTNTRLLREIGQENNWGGVALEGFDFLGGAETAASSPSATAVTIPYSSVSLVEYRWDAGAAGYRRWTAREPHVDSLSGQQLVANNVIILYTESWAATELIDDPRVMSLRFRLTGEGHASLFRDGQVFEGRWSRRDPEGTVRFLDANGRPFLLRPGNVWVQVVTPPVVPTWEP